VTAFAFAMTSAAATTISSLKNIVIRDVQRPQGPRPAAHVMRAAGKSNMPDKGFFAEVDPKGEALVCSWSHNGVKA